MKWKTLFLGYVPCKKQNPLAGAVLSGVGSLASSLASQQAQSAENEEARAWQEKMWNKTNEYNSPANQKRLLQEAGYNPYLFGNDYNGNGASLPSSPSNQPLPGLKNPISDSVGSFSQMRSLEQQDISLLQQGQQIESNVELQKMKAIQTISESMLSLYKDGGQKAVDEFMSFYAPQLKALNFSGSPYEQMLQKKFREMDINNNRNQLEFSLREQFGAKEYEKKLAEIDALISKYGAEVNKLVSEGSYNYASIRALGSRMARDFAEAGLLGSKASEINALLPYTRSLMEDNVLRSDMDYQDKQSEFVYGSKIRDYKKTSYGQMENKWNFASEHNPIVDFMRGFSTGLPVSPFNPSGSSLGIKYYGREGFSLNDWRKYVYVNE